MRLSHLLSPDFKRVRARAVPLDAYGLTPREREVAGWVAVGKTNPEIARILGMRPRTAEKHLEHILGKLGVENRTAAAVLIASVLNGG